MSCEGIEPAADVQLVTEWAGPAWMTGQMIREPVPNPVVFEVDEDYDGELLPMYDDSILLMRDDLLASLSAAGVDNLQTFPAVVRGPGSQTHSNYKAVNIVGLISCANMDSSVRVPGTESDLIDVDFESLVIDEERTGGALLFRLAEAVNAIVVHRAVRERVEAAIPGMTFYESGEWAG